MCIPAQSNWLCLPAPWMVTSCLSLICIVFPLVHQDIEKHMSFGMANIRYRCPAQCQCSQHPMLPCEAPTRQIRRSARPCMGLPLRCPIFSGQLYSFWSSLGPAVSCGPTAFCATWTHSRSGIHILLSLSCCPMRIHWRALDSNIPVHLVSADAL